MAGAAQAQGFFMPEPPVDANPQIEQHLKNYHATAAGVNYTQRRRGILVSFNEPGPGPKDPPSRLEVFFDSNNVARYTSTLLLYGRPVLQTVGGDTLKAIQKYADKAFPGLKVESLNLTTCDDCYTDPKTGRTYTKTLTFSVGTERWFFDRGGRFLKKEDDYLLR